MLTRRRITIGLILLAVALIGIFGVSHTGFIISVIVAVFVVVLGLGVMRGMRDAAAQAKDEARRRQR